MYQSMKKMHFCCKKKMDTISTVKEFPSNYFNLKQNKKSIFEYFL